MNARDQIASKLAACLPWQRILFCAACAERAAPVVRGMGSAKARKLVDEALELLWSAPLQADVRAAAARLIRALEKTPDSRCDDSDRPLFKSTQAMGSVWHALRVLGPGDPLKDAKHASYNMFYLAECLDGCLLPPGQADDAAVGPMESSEAAAQLESLEQLASQSAATPEWLAALRQRAADGSSQWERATRELQRHDGSPDR